MGSLFSSLRSLLAKSQVDGHRFCRPSDVRSRVAMLYCYSSCLSRSPIDSCRIAWMAIGRRSETGCAKGTADESVSV